MEHIIADESEEIYTKCMWSALLIRARSSKPFFIETQWAVHGIETTMLRPSKMDPERMDTNKPKSEELYCRRQNSEVLQAAILSTIH